MLGRLAARMRVRDDEDLAIEQLPAGPAPGRADDPDLHERTGAEPIAAGHNEERARLRQLRGELSALTAQHTALPLREVRTLEAIDTELARAAEQRAELSARLESLPAPVRPRLGRSRDAHAGERAT